MKYVQTPRYRKRNTMNVVAERASQSTRRSAENAKRRWDGEAWCVARGLENTTPGAFETEGRSWKRQNTGKI